MNPKIDTCERTKHMYETFTGKYKEKCGRKAVIIDNHGRKLCLRCYNKHQYKILGVCTGRITWKEERVVLHES